SRDPAAPVCDRAARPRSSNPTPTSARHAPSGTAQRLRPTSPIQLPARVFRSHPFTFPEPPKHAGTNVSPLRPQIMLVRAACASDASASSSLVCNAERSEISLLHHRRSRTVLDSLCLCGETHLSFSVVKANSANTRLATQNRTITLLSLQPINSK